MIDRSIDPRSVAGRFLLAPLSDRIDHRHRSDFVKGSVPPSQHARYGILSPKSFALKTCHTILIELCTQLVLPFPSDPEGSTRICIPLPGPFPP